LHKELLSDKERQMIRQFLVNGEKGEGFRMLKMRIKRNYQTIAEDFELISKADKKFNLFP
jgi:peroxiredoxin